MERKIYLTNIEELFLAELERRGLKRGIDFSTQYPLRYSFILDFAWPDKQIAIELDGEAWHSPKKDAMKNALLKKNGWEVIRFPGKQIMEDVVKCVDQVLEVVNEKPS